VPKKREFPEIDHFLLFYRRHVTASQSVAETQIILSVNFRRCDIMTPTLLKFNFMQYAGLIVFSQVVNLEGAFQGQDKVCVNVQ
jgi:hypothetical protein